MKRKLIITLVIVFIIILLSVGVYFILKARPKTESDKDAAESDVPPIIDGIPVANISTYGAANFPLKKGMRGDLVANVQKYLASNVACINTYKVTGASIPEADGVFGPITEKSLKSCKGTTTVSKELYDQMMTVAAPAASTGIKKSDKVYLSGSQAMLYTYPQNKPEYFFGKVSKTVFLDKPIGIFVEDVSGGFAKITVGGYEPYTKATGGYGPFKAESKTVFIYKSSLRKTPY